jgi:putative transposase
MCKVMQVSRSSYYASLTKTPSKKSIRRHSLLNDIRRVYTASKGIYGSPRVTKELNQEGIKTSSVTVAKLMKLHNIKSKVRKKYKTTTDSKHHYPVAENLLNQQFLVSEPATVWVSDITYVSTKQGWLYLTTVIDLYDRKVIGWSLSEGMKAVETSVAAFNMACTHRPIPHNNELIVHSDRGVQYACTEFLKALAKYPKLQQSMSRKGNCWDNAVAESFFKTLKTELIYHNNYTTKEQAALSIFEYIETFYNTTRRHQHLNNLSLKEHSLLTKKQKNVA